MNLVLEVPTKLPSSLGLYSVHRVKMVSKDVPPVIELLDEEEEEWPDAGAQNPEEAQQYVNKINNIFDHLSELIHEDKKDALGDDHPTLQNVIMKQWVMMGDVDVNAVLHTIKDPATVYL